MSSVGDQAVGTVPTTRRPWTTWLRHGLLAWWVLAAVAVLALGARPSGVAELLDAVQQGRVDAVEVVGEDLPPGASGWTTQTVTWRDGPWLHTATVVLASPDQVEEARSSTSGTVVTEPVADQVRQRDPSVAVDVATGFPPTAQRVLGVLLPSWLMLCVVAAQFLSLGLVVNGSEPWRATRWAWAWGVLLAGPVGAIAFALFSGPLGRLPGPPPGARRLSGAWGFLLALVVGGLTVDIV